MNTNHSGVGGVRALGWSTRRLAGSGGKRGYLPSSYSRLFVSLVVTSSELATALRERLTIIKDAESRRDPEKHLARLKEISEKIDHLAGALPRPVDPQLAHFLQRKSYDKALEFLEPAAKPRG